MGLSGADADAVLPTHGHNDHVESLTALIEGGFDRLILDTRATLEVAATVLRDGLGLQGATEVTRVIRRLDQLKRAVQYDQETEVDRFAGRVSFREAGHISGSASINVQSSAARAILSGDLSGPDSPLFRDDCQASGERTIDLVIMESAYGDKDHRCSQDDVEHKLESIIRRAVSRKGNILVPAFAIGRPPNGTLSA